MPESYLPTYITDADDVTGLWSPSIYVADVERFINSMRIIFERSHGRESPQISVVLGDLDHTETLKRCQAGNAVDRYRRKAGYNIGNNGLITETTEAYGSVGTDIALVLVEGGTPRAWHTAENIRHRIECDLSLPWYMPSRHRMRRAYNDNGLAFTGGPTMSFGITSCHYEDDGFVVGGSHDFPFEDPAMAEEGIYRLAGKGIRISQDAGGNKVTIMDNVPSEEVRFIQIPRVMLVEFLRSHLYVRDLKVAQEATLSFEELPY